MSRETWVTTLDNPFDPFDEAENWRRYDEDHGYFTNSYVARIAIVHDEMTDDTINDQIEDAVDQIVKLNLTGIYRKAIKGENNVLSPEKREKLLQMMRNGEI